MPVLGQDREKVVLVPALGPVPERELGPVMVEVARERAKVKVSAMIVILLFLLGCLNFMSSLNRELTRACHHCWTWNPVTQRTVICG